MKEFNEDYRTDSIIIAENIKKSILEGEFKMGIRLPQRFLAERFSTTTTVVREALRIVEKEGLLTIIPRIGAVIKQIDEETLYDKYIMREALEVMSARLANQNMTEEDARKLKELATECDRILPYDKVSKQEKAQLHFNLHNYIAQMSKSKNLIAALENISLSFMMIRNAFNIQWIDEYPLWHSKLVNVIIEGTPEEAEEMMRVHVKRGYEMEKERIQKEPKIILNGGCE